MASNRDSKLVSNSIDYITLNYGGQRRILVIDGMPYYCSTGYNSSYSGVWFPFMQLRGTKALSRDNLPDDLCKATFPLGAFNESKYVFMKLQRSFFTKVPESCFAHNQMSERLPTKETVLTSIRLSGKRFPEYALEELEKNSLFTSDEIKKAKADPIVVAEKELFVTDDPDRVNEWLITKGATIARALIPQSKETATPLPAVLLPPQSKQDVTPSKAPMCLMDASVEQPTTVSHSKSLPIFVKDETTSAEEFNKFFSKYVGKYSDNKLHLNLEEKSFQENIERINNIMNELGGQFNPPVLVAFKYRHVSLPSDQRLLAKCFKLMVDEDRTSAMDDTINAIENLHIRLGIRKYMDTYRYDYVEIGKKFDEEEKYLMQSRQYEGHGQYTLYFSEGITPKTLCNFVQVLNERLSKEQTLVKSTSIAENSSPVVNLISYREGSPDVFNKEYVAPRKTERSIIASEIRKKQESSEHYQLLKHTFLSRLPTQSAEVAQKEANQNASELPCLLEVSLEQLTALSLFAAPATQAQYKAPAETKTSKTEPTEKISPTRQKAQKIASDMLNKLPTYIERLLPICPELNQQAVVRDAVYAWVKQNDYNLDGKPDLYSKEELCEKLVIYTPYMSHGQVIGMRNVCANIFDRLRSHITLINTYSKLGAHGLDALTENDWETLKSSELFCERFKGEIKAFTQNSTRLKPG